MDYPYLMQCKNPSPPECGAGEVAEPLGEGFYIIQPKKGEGYRFGSDAVSLAKFAAGVLPRDLRVFDICSGCGVVGLLTSLYTRATVTGAEIDKKLCDMSNRTARHNGIPAEFINADIRGDALNGYGGAFDAVVCNPPYYKANMLQKSVAPTASAELTVKLTDVLDRAKLLLGANGKLLMVYAASRLHELMFELGVRGFECKSAVISENCKTALVNASLGAKRGAMDLRIAPSDARY